LQIADCRLQIDRRRWPGRGAALGLCWLALAVFPGGAGAAAPAAERAPDLWEKFGVVEFADGQPAPAFALQDLDGRILAWNPGAARMYGWNEAEALLMNVRDRIPEALQKDALAKVHDLSRAAILEPYRTQRLTKDGAVVEVWMTATALVNEAGQMYAIVTTERAKESKID